MVGARVRGQGPGRLLLGPSQLFQGSSWLFQGLSQFFQGLSQLFQGPLCGCGQCCPLGVCLSSLEETQVSLDNLTGHSPHSLCLLITAWNVTAHQAWDQQEKNSGATQSWQSSGQKHRGWHFSPSPPYLWKSLFLVCFCFILFRELSLESHAC